MESVGVLSADRDSGYSVIRAEKSKKARNSSRSATEPCLSILDDGREIRTA
jgi:hypothetical protein